MPPIDAATVWVVVVLLFLIGFPLFLILYLRARGRLKRTKRELEQEIHREHTQREETEKRFAPIVDMNAELAKLRSEANEVERKIDTARATYAEKRQLLERLEHDVAIYDERLSFAEMGVYERHFDFTDSDSYKEAIKAVRAKQKAMVQAKSAVTCSTDWMVEGSAAKGRTMINRQIRLTLRAFCNECEAAIANTRWNNVNAMQKRIQRAAEQINSLNASMNIIIDAEFVNLWLEELWLTHEYRETLKRERDERAEAARLAREEQKLLREAEAAEREEQRYEAMLAAAREAAERDAGNEDLRNRVAQLEADLAAAHAATERARSMAELTRSGYVYVISNIGSFGEDVVKIGLTRRLDPDDRVRELGDASVPFSFDTHAMIYSDDAPALESALHNEFADRRINMSNMRKEFFRVGIEEVEQAVHRLAPCAQFFSDREAQEWHETMARRRQEADELMRSPSEALPASI